MTIHDTASGPAQSAVAGKIEAHGIDMIPDSERTGSPRSLFALWAAPNVNYLAFVVGSALVLMGLSLWQAIGAIAVGTLFALAPGIVAVSGPASGTPSQIVTRAMYGVRGNRVAIAINGWFVSICYVALNWAAASVIGFGLAERLGIDTTTPVKIAVILTIAAATMVVAIYGQATILKLYGPLSVVLLGVFTVVAVYAAINGDWTFRSPEPLHGADLWITVAAGATLVASTPLSYTITSDLARYLPRNTNPFAVAGYTSLGHALPSFTFLCAGALAATSVDMSDAQTGLDSMLPAWFEPIFMVSIIVGTLCNNAITTYSAGLALQVMGIKTTRARGVVASGLVAASMTMYALLVFDFLDAVSSALVLLVALVGPIMAVYITDIIMRRNRYDGAELSDCTPDSRFWYTGGVNVAGAVACLGAALAALMCVNAPAFTGPVAKALGGLDISIPVGMVLATVLYVVVTRALYNGKSA